MGAALALPERISLLGWLRIAVRLWAMLLLLAISVPLYYLFRIARGRNPVPGFFLGGIGWIAGVEWRVTGQQAGRNCFLIVNHVSWIDIPAIAATTGAAFVGHDGLASMPVLRWLCAMNDTVFVARHDRASVHLQVAQVREAVRRSGALAIFPEGTTSDGTGLLAFKSSLLSALDPVPPGVAVQPVLLDFGAEAADIAWVGEEHGLANFLRILSRGRAVELTVRFLPPLQGAALENRKTMAAASRDAMLAAIRR